MVQSNKVFSLKLFVSALSCHAEHPLHWTGFATADLCFFLRLCTRVILVAVLSTPASNFGVRRSGY